MFAESAQQEVIEKRDAGPHVQVQLALGHIGEPVLFVIAHRVDGSQRPGLSLGQLQRPALLPECDGLLESD